MRIVIDMQGAQTNASKNRGVGRYTRELTKALVKYCTADDEVFLALNGALKESCDEIRKQFSEIIPLTNIKTWNWYPSVPVGYARNQPKIQKAEELFYEWFLQQFEADIIWRPNLQEGLNEENIITAAKSVKSSSRVCTTLHDVVPMLFASDYLRPGVEEWYRSKINFAAMSDSIITDSEFSKNQIIRFLDVPEEKVTAIYNGFDNKRFYADEEFLSGEKKKKTILYVGGADKHKNLNALIEAYSLLPAPIRAEYTLELMGYDPYNAKDTLTELINKNGISLDSVIFSGAVSDSEMREALQRCAVFVFPFYSEGFGLPVLEAMACGAPVLAANAASLPEIVQDSDLLFDPYNPHDIAAKITNLISNKTLATEKIQQLLVRAEKFSWDDAGKCLYQHFYDQADVNPLSKQYYTLEMLCSDLGLLCANQDYLYKLNVARSINDSILFSKPRHIYIECSSVVQVNFVTGIQRVVNAVISSAKEIFAGNVDIQPIPVYSDVDKPGFYRAVYNGEKYVRSDVEDNTSIVSFRDGDVLILADLHPRMIVSKEAFLMDLVRRGVHVSTILHDLIPVYYSSFYPPEHVQEFMSYLRTINKFSSVISISQAVSNLYMDWLEKEGIQPNARLDFAHHGADFEKANATKGLPENYQETIEALRKRPTYLMVSTIEPRKRHAEIFSAVEKMWNRGVDVNICFVGRNGWQMDAFVHKLRNHAELNKRLFWLEGISDEYLDMIYEEASAVVVASLEEGFGLPIVEAALHGKPLILRDIPVFREIAGDHAFYFTGETPEEVRERLEEWLHLYSEHKEPKSDGIRILSWKEATEIRLRKIDVSLVDSKVFIP